MGSPGLRTAIVFRSVLLVAIRQADVVGLFGEVGEAMRQGVVTIPIRVLAEELDVAKLQR